MEENSDYLKSEYLTLGLIKIIISNTTDDEITVDLTAFHIESGAFSLQFYYPLVMYYNDCGMYIKLSKGEQKTLLHPFLSLLNNFSIMIPPILETERIIWNHLYILKK